ncbi:PREDICTED: pumilio homolog 15-like [Camelina sativa]|uniref:S-protein homolog n=1 Tax=Camelina sativa TaxID=90675 RepID=A0ABM0YDI6_CAMSA|nr:PREDICTED: pumilio homolog 15-like [Camelina sativa]
MKYLLVFLIVYGQCIIGNVSAGQTNYLEVWNDLNVTLFVHCKSGSSDRKGAYKQPGQLYPFPIRDNFWKTTLFWCTLRQGPNWKKGRKFDVYKYEKGVAQGAYYIWRAKKDGIYFQRNKNPLHKVWDWMILPN